MISYVWGLHLSRVRVNLLMASLLDWTSGHPRPATSTTGQTGAQATLGKGLGEPREGPALVPSRQPAFHRALEGSLLGGSHPGTWILTSWDRTPGTRYPVHSHQRTCLMHPKLPWPGWAQPRGHKASVQPRSKLASRALTLELGQKCGC